MRKAILVLSVILLVACQPRAEQTTGTSAVVNDLYAAFAEGEIEAVLGAMSDDIAWNEAEHFPYADGNPYIGPQAVLEGVFARIGADWEYWNLSVDQVVESGEDVIAFGRYSGKNKQTGKTINAQFTHHWTIRDGKAVGFQQYADTAQVLAAME